MITLTIIISALPLRLFHLIFIVVVVKINPGPPWMTVPMEVDQRLRDSCNKVNTVACVLLSWFPSGGSGEGAGTTAPLLLSSIRQSDFQGSRENRWSNACIFAQTGRCSPRSCLYIEYSRREKCGKQRQSTQQWRLTTFIIHYESEQKHRIVLHVNLVNDIV